MTRKVLVLAFGGIIVVAAVLCWNLHKKAVIDDMVCQATENVMEKAYEAKNSPEGKRVVAKVGDFNITYGDVFVMGQFIACSLKKTPAEVQTANQDDLQCGFVEIVHRALFYCAARQRGINPAWDEVKEKREIELRGMSNTKGDPAYSGISRSQLRHLSDDMEYTIMIFAGKEYLKELDKTEELDIKDSKKLTDHMNQLMNKFSLSIYDPAFKQPLFWQSKLPD